MKDSDLVARILYLKKECESLRTEVMSVLNSVETDNLEVSEFVEKMKGALTALDFQSHENDETIRFLDGLVVEGEKIIEELLATQTRIADDIEKLQEELDAWDKERARIEKKG